MTFSSSYKIFLNSLKSDFEILKESEYLNYVFLEGFLETSKKIEEIFKRSKLNFGLVLSKKNHDLIKKHCGFWAKVVKSNLYNMATLQKILKFRFFQNITKKI